MLTLYHAPRSRSGRIIWLLEELGADYALRHVSIRYGDGSGDGPDAANPHPDKKVPALDHDGTIVTESTAVAIYLCDLLPAAGLAPQVGDAERGDYLTWIVWADSEFGPALYARMMGADDERSRANFDAAARRLTDALDRGPYLMGERFTAVDVMAGAALLWLRQLFPASEAIDAYVARITARPAHARAVAVDAPGGQAA